MIKLLAICERYDGGISVRVHPAMLPRMHPLAAVHEAYNAVFVEAEAAGRLMFYGAGAGGQPTASAVLGDIVAVARNLRAGMRGPEPATYAELPVVPMARALTRYYVCLDVADRPGVLAPVAESFARRGVSIKAVHQEGRGEDATPDHRDPHRQRSRRWPRPSPTWPPWRRCAPSTACCASRARKASDPASGLAGGSWGSSPGTHGGGDRGVR